MTQASPSLDRARAEATGSGFDLGRVLLEGRAYFALIAIVVVFSVLSPYYLSVSNFLTMSSHVALFGILAIGMLLIILRRDGAMLAGFDSGSTAVAPVRFEATRRHRSRGRIGVRPKPRTSGATGG